MAKKKSQQLREVGEKIRSERLVSSYIRGVGNEVTEVWTPDSPDPDKQTPELISKAEMLARDIWREALHGIDDKLRFEYRKLVLDRIEGKPASGDVAEPPKRPSIPDKVSDFSRDRLNQMAEAEVEDDRD